MLEDQINFINNHWVDQVSPPTYEREIFPLLVEYLARREIITLIGPRRVGKTTLMQQLISHLLSEKRIAPKNILFFSFDLYHADLLLLLNTYQKLTGVNDRAEMIYLFLDEIQYLENWAAQLKLVWDARENIKIVVSGSSASDLNRGKESLAGREIQISIDPLNPSEYLDIKGKPLVTEKHHNNLYHKYIYQQLPQLAIEDDASGHIISQLVDKVINYDMIRLYKIKQPSVVTAIFRMICKDPGQIINYQDLAQDFDINMQTAKAYLKYLENSLLIRKLYNYTRNARKSEKAHKRYYPYFTTLITYANPYPVDLGKIAETEVAFQVKPEFFWNKRGREVDFIVGEELKTGIEVKMRNTIRLRDIKTLLDKDDLDRKIVIHKYLADLPDLDEVEFVSMNRIAEKITV